jgi:hypothetical protein
MRSLVGGPLLLPVGITSFARPTPAVDVQVLEEYPG